MALNQALIAELQYEAASTRKLLERVPENHFDFKPHPKSMVMDYLSIHIAEIPTWLEPTINADEIDFGTMDYKPPTAKNNAELLKIFDESLKIGVAALEKADDANLMHNWAGKNKGVVVFEMPRIQVIRSMIFNHLYHHRGQLTVYLRLLDVPLPGIYGPTADEQM